MQEKYRCLSREVSMLALPMTPTSRHKSSGNVPTATVVGPGNMAAISHLPLTDRLQEDSTTPFKIHATPPSTASLGVLISQAITSGDDKLLEEVLKVTKEKLVTATVKKLPLHLVLPFMRKVRTWAVEGEGVGGRKLGCGLWKVRTWAVEGELGMNSPPPTSSPS